MKHHSADISTIHFVNNPLHMLTSANGQAPTFSKDIPTKEDNIGTIKTMTCSGNPKTWINLGTPSCSTSLNDAIPQTKEEMQSPAYDSQAPRPSPPAAPAKSEKRNNLRPQARIARAQAQGQESGRRNRKVPAVRGCDAECSGRLGQKAASACRGRQAQGARAQQRRRQDSGGSRAGGSARAEAAVGEPQAQAPRGAGGAAERQARSAAPAAAARAPPRSSRSRTASHQRPHTPRNASPRPTSVTLPPPLVHTPPPPLPFSSSSLPPVLGKTTGVEAHTSVSISCKRLYQQILRG